jgi:uncharacterized damage-inducible protein DinB
VNAGDVLTDAFGRLPGLVRGAVRDLTPEQLRWTPAAGANPIGWLVWHLTRIHDDHVADVLGAEQVYVTGGWAPRFGREPGDLATGYGHSVAEVATVRPESWRALVDYHAAVHGRTAAFLARVADADLDRVVDEAWDPPVTLGVRLVSVVNDAAQHAGQAAYVRGLLRPGPAGRFRRTAAG